MFYNIKKVCSTTYFLRDARRAQLGAHQRASRAALPPNLFAARGSALPCQIK